MTIPNSLSITVGQAISFLSNFVSFILIARYLSVSDFATFTILLAIFAVTSKLSEISSLTIALKSFISPYIEGVSLNEQLTVRYLGALSGFLVSFVYIYFSFANINIYFCAALLGLIVMFSSRIDSVRNFYEQPFKADAKMHQSVVSSLIENLTLIGGLLLLFSFQTENKLLSVCFVYGFSGILGFIYLVSKQKKYYPLLKIKYPNAKVLKKIVRYSFPVALWGVLNIMFQQMDLLFLKYMASENMVAEYAVAMRMTVPLLFLIVPIHTVFYPKLLREIAQNGKTQSELISSIFKIYILVPLIIFLPLLFQTEYVVTFIFGSQYALAATPFLILLGNQICVFFIFLGSDILISENRQHHIAVIIFLMIVVNGLIILGFSDFNLLLVVSLAKVIASVIGGIVIVFYLLRLKIKPNISFLKIIIVSLSAIVFNIVIASFVSVVIQIVSVLFISLLLIRWLGIFSKHELLQIKEIIKS